jgi:hypothetical protein
MGGRKEKEMSKDIEERALNLLRTMGALGKAAVDGDPIAKPFIEADAIRVENGVPIFHKERFLATLFATMSKEDA